MARTAPDSTRRSERARTAILAAALDEVAEVGYAKLCIEGIAARAGVGKQTIYRWWRSKGAVVFDAFLELSDGDPTLPDTGDLEADLKTVMRATVAELDDPRISAPMHAVQTAIAGDEELAASYAEKLDAPVKAAKRERLRSAQAAGQLAEDVDLDIAIDLLWGPVLNHWQQCCGPLTPEYADRVVETALNGLRPR
jgi:AcrR family transcriptional regulator